MLLPPEGRARQLEHLHEVSSYMDTVLEHDSLAWDGSSAISSVRVLSVCPSIWESELAFLRDQQDEGRQTTFVVRMHFSPDTSSTSSRCWRNSETTSPFSPSRFRCERGGVCKTFAARQDRNDAGFSCHVGDHGFLLRCSCRPHGACVAGEICTFRSSAC